MDWPSYYDDFEFKQDDSKFSEPMPWIGLYIALASSICAVAMAADVVHGFRYRKFWFPCKFFGINAATLIIISVAVKLSVDINTSMPLILDQLAKLSSNAFLCTAISHSLPSLGTMETGEMLMNMVALGILVITVIVNVCIQLVTGVIFSFWLAHVVLMMLMVVLFVLVISSSLAIPTTKDCLDIKFQQKYAVVNEEECVAAELNNNSNTSLTQKLRDDLTKYWMMAHTCNPQFVLGRSATCTASGAFCLLSTMILLLAMTRNNWWTVYIFHNSRSDYRWSIPVVFISQVIAVLIGTIAPASRWFLAIKFRRRKKSKKKSSMYEIINVEVYWLKKLCHLKERPLELQIASRHVRKLVHIVKDMALDLCIWIQKGMVTLSKFVRLISIFIVHKLLLIRFGCKKLTYLIRCKKTKRDINLTPEPTKIDLSHYILHLQGEEELIDVMIERNHDVTDHWMKIGRKKQPKNLVTELEKLNPAREFEGPKKFDSDKVLSLHCKEPPNNWSLPIVTLTSIAFAISGDDFNRAQELIKLVNEGIKYIRVVENNLNVKRDLTRIKQTADVVWAGVDLHYKWLDLDLQEISCKGRSPKEIFSQLSDTAKNKFNDVRNTEASMDDPLRWPLKSLAANSMYRICETLLLKGDEESSECRKAMFDKIKSMIVDIIGACLINLKDAILMKCHKSSIEHREEDVSNAIILLGETEKILEILGAVETLPCTDREALACINEWRSLVVENDRPSSNHSCGSSDQNSGFEESSSSDLCLNIECVED